jgi:protein-S-isoprenylcysteine O-methyltransferase Ste14
MTSITSMEPGTTAAERTSAVESRGVDSDGSRQRSARKTVVATSVVAAIAVISAVVGMVFPEMFAAAVAVTVLALVVALDWVFDGRGQRQAPRAYWTL